MTALESFVEHAKSSRFEVCGLVVNFKGKEIYYPCNNIASDRINEFSIDPIDYAKYSTMGDIIFICHSHVNATEQPSKADMITCNAGKVPWVIYSKVTNRLHIEKPSGYKEKLFGREYIFNISDCWTFIIDLYKEELNIDLLKVTVPNIRWYKESNSNYFERYAEDSGFFKVTDGSIKKYDVLLFIMGDSTIPNHSGVYYGDNLLAHHAYGRLSCKEVYGGYWAKTKAATYRHRGV